MKHLSSFSKVRRVLPIRQGKRSYSSIVNIRHLHRPGTDVYVAKKHLNMIATGLQQGLFPDPAKTTQGTVPTGTALAVEVETETDQGLTAVASRFRVTILRAASRPRLQRSAERCGNGRLSRLAPRPCHGSRLRCAIQTPMMLDAGVSTAFLLFWRLGSTSGSATVVWCLVWSGSTVLRAVCEEGLSKNWNEEIADSV